MFALHTDWKSILAKAWSIRWLIVAGLLQGLEQVMPVLEPILPVPAWVFGALSGLAIGAAFVSRLLAQKNIPDL